MTRRIKAKPQIKKREAKALAQQAETDPLGALKTIVERERSAIIDIGIWRFEPGKPLSWTCSISFGGAAYAASGKSTSPGPAVKQAILRAYDTGSERDWQLRDKSFHETENGR
jgi:hypothetical protein